MRTRITWPFAVSAVAVIAACQMGRQPTAPASPKVVQVVVAPATANVAVGTSQQFTAYGRRNTGDSVAVNASYSATGGTITAAGLYTAGSSAGTFRVIAQDPSTSLADTGTIAVTSVAPPPPATPGTVANLAVTAATDSSLTVSFTEVSDGTGQPASYEMRWAAGTISWGSAASVTRGTCATPVAGTAIGAMHTCTVLGLAPSTAYQLQIIAFSGTLNVNAVFGGLSNAASGTTAANTAPVASVTVSPATASVAVGQTLQLSATLKDANGNTLSGRAVTWTSGAPPLGTVSAGGLVSGVAAGLVSITATSEGVSGSASITVTAAAPPPSGAWPNEPAGLTVLSDEPFSALVDGGWNAVQRQTTNGSGLFAGLDATAPHSPAGVLQFTFASGFVAGSEPGVEYYDAASPVKETYFAFWWKPSSPWQNNSNSNVNKIAFLFPTTGDVYIMMQGTGSGYQLAVEPEFPGDVRVMTPNVTGTPVALGQWHLVEWYVKYATTGSSADGVTKWWLDGVLQGSYTDLQTPGDAGFTEYQLAPTWGGVVGTKAETDFYWFDHARISRR